MFTICVFSRAQNYAKDFTVTDIHQNPAEFCPRTTESCPVPSWKLLPLGIMEAPIEPPSFNPSLEYIAVMYLYRGFQGDINFLPMMPKEASLSDTFLM